MKALAALALAGTVALHAGIPLARGTYVLSSTPCADAPFAAMKTFDGAAFAGPHEAKCSTRVLSRRGDVFRTATTCRANGDGSPAAPSTQVATLRIRSGTAFEQMGSGDPRRALRYRLCPAGT